MKWIGNHLGVRLTVLYFLLIALFDLEPAYAQPPEPGEWIRNEATATFQNPEVGALESLQSNSVELQVGASEGEQGEEAEEETNEDDDSDQQPVVNDPVLTLSIAEDTLLIGEPFQLSHQIILDKATSDVGVSVDIDGEEIQTPLFVTMLPQGVFLNRSIDTTQVEAGIKVLYKIAGSERYASQAPEQLKSVSGIAFILPSLRSDHEENSTNNSVTMTLTPLELVVRGEIRGIEFKSEYIAALDRQYQGQLEKDVSTSPIVEFDRFTVSELQTAQPVIPQQGQTVVITVECVECDLDSEKIDSIASQIRSSSTQVVMDVLLVETGPRDAVFVSDPIALVGQRAAQGIGENEGNSDFSPEIDEGGVVDVNIETPYQFTTAVNDELTIVYQTPSGLTQTQTILVDPAGYLFDDQSGVPITDAEVALYRVTTNFINGEQTLRLAEVFEDAAGTLPAPNPIDTNDEGYYAFPFVASGNYLLRVTRLPEGYLAPSTRSGAQMGELVETYRRVTGQNNQGEIALGESATIAQGGSYEGVFAVVDEPVFIDIPIQSSLVFDQAQRQQQGLMLSLTADQRIVSLGEVVRYQAKVKNLTGSRISNAELRLAPPYGFVFQEDSVKVQMESGDGEERGENVDSEEGEESEGSVQLDKIAKEENEWVITLDDFESQASQTINFILSASPAALSSNGIATAIATGRSGSEQGLIAVQQVSQRQSVKVSIQKGFFDDQGLIFGTLFYDCNGDGLQNQAVHDESQPLAAQQPIEKGVAGVKLYLQNGRYVITDQYGRYSFPRVRPGTYVIKPDLKLFKGRWRLTHRTVLQGERHDLMFADVVEGEMFRADFPLEGCSEEAEGGSSAYHENNRVVIKDKEKTDNNANDTVRKTTNQQINQQINQKANKTIDQKTEDENLFIFPKRHPMSQKETTDIESTHKDNKNKNKKIIYATHIFAAQTQVHLRVHRATEVALKVGDLEIDNRYLGEVQLIPETTFKTLIYYGIPLKPGINTLTAVAKDHWGNVRQQETLQLYRSGPLDKIYWEQARYDFTADTHSTFHAQQRESITLHLDDKRGVPIEEDLTVTLTIVTQEGQIIHWDETDLNANQPGLQIKATRGKATVDLISPGEPTVVRVIAEAGLKTAETTLTYRPNLRRWIVAGALEGSMSRTVQTQANDARALIDNGIGNSNSTVIESLKGDLQHWDLDWNNGNNRAAVRGSVFAKGSLYDQYLVTIIADTEQRVDEGWRFDLESEQDFPLYGDESEGGVEGRASKGLFARIERDDDFAQIGDFRPYQDSRLFKVGAYQRQLYGYQQLYRSDQWQMQAFAAQTKQTQITDDIRARGTSGPFRLSQPNLLANSVRVEVLVRSRAPDGDIVAQTPLRPFIDYEVNAVLGSILLRSPLSGVDTQGRPQYLRVTYNVEEEDAQHGNLIGSDATFQINDSLTLASRVILEDDPQHYYQLVDAALLYQPTDELTIQLEQAETQVRDDFSRTTGYGSSIHVAYKKSWQQLSLSLASASNQFENPSAGVTKGTRNGELHYQERINDEQDWWFHFSNFEQASQDNTHRKGEFGLSHTFSERFSGDLSLAQSYTKNSAFNGGLGSAHSLGDVRQPLIDTSIGAQLTYQPEWLEALSLQAAQYQSVSTTRYHQSVVADYQIREHGHIHGRWELYDGYTINGDLSHDRGSRQRWSLGVRQQVHHSTELFSEYRLEEAMHGQSNTFATGMNMGFDLQEQLRLTAQMERTLDLADNPSDPVRYSGALGLSNFAATDHKWTSRIELLGGAKKSWMQELRWAKKLAPGWAGLVRERLQWRSSLDHRLFETTFGLSHRPIGYQWSNDQRSNHPWDWLGWVSLKKDTLDPLHPYSKQQFKQTLNIKPSRPLTLSLGLGVQRYEQQSETKFRSYLWLHRYRLKYDFPSRPWSVSTMMSYLTDRREGGFHRGYGVEVQRSVGESLLIGLGYFRFGYKDVDFDPTSRYQNGVRLHLAAKFDEHSLRGLLSRFE